MLAVAGLLNLFAVSVAQETAACGRGAAMGSDLLVTATPATSTPRSLSPGCLGSGCLASAAGSGAPWLPLVSLAVLDVCASFVHAHGCGALPDADEVFAWGRRSFHGGLGTGGTDDATAPREVAALRGRRVLALGGGWGFSAWLCAPAP